MAAGGALGGGTCRVGHGGAWRGRQVWAAHSWHPVWCPACAMQHERAMHGGRVWWCKRAHAASQYMGRAGHGICAASSIAITQTLNPNKQGMLVAGRALTCSRRSSPGGQAPAAAQRSRTRGPSACTTAGGTRSGIAAPLAVTGSAPLQPGPGDAAHRRARRQWRQEHRPCLEQQALSHGGELLLVLCRRDVGAQRTQRGHQAGGVQLGARQRRLGSTGPAANRGAGCWAALGRRAPSVTACTHRENCSAAGLRNSCRQPDL